VILLLEMRGPRWALTRFAFDAFGATDSEDMPSTLGDGAEKEVHY
jgi:hypothetical protein